jgi:hypothetical protein
MIKKIICLFKGHTGLIRGTETTGHYVRIPAGRGAFCRDPERYEHDGRLYRCARCGALILHHGICSWELEDLMNETLRNIPVSCWDVGFNNQDYEFIRLYK